MIKRVIGIAALSLVLSGCTVINAVSSTPAGKLVSWMGFSHLMVAAGVKESSYKFGKEFLSLGEDGATAFSVGATCLAGVAYTFREYEARGTWDVTDWGADSFVDAALPIAYCVHTVNSNYDLFGD